ncbi:PREDICTED: E3 ubiquitin-protein ligase HECW2-like [Rhagoletis zephyria]|uniref:E3 ubiquitin-protein ligase HECW2-like n=1 Tax=Rhagoletis zephyria TaxID=28612 RepID=UPI000811A037|nr:PREDICTED: E3 ubiquitin-protein ligase HECW2-like [Rhagoletis zephyria]
MCCESDKKCQHLSAISPLDPVAPPLLTAAISKSDFHLVEVYCLLSNNNVGNHSSAGGSGHNFHHTGSSGSGHRGASSGTKPTNFNYQSLNSHLINGSAAAINNSPVLNIQQQHLSGNSAPSDINGTRNSSASLFSSLLPATPSTSQKPPATHSKRDAKQSPQTAPVTLGSGNQFYFQPYLQNRDLIIPATTTAASNSATTATITTTQNHSSGSLASHSLDHLPGYNHPMLNVSTKNSSTVQPQTTQTVQSPSTYSHFILSNEPHNLAENFPPAPPLPPKHQKAITGFTTAKQPLPHLSLLNRKAPQPRPSPPTSSTASQQYKAPSGLLIERTPNIFESLVGQNGQSNRGQFPQTPPPVPYSSPKPQRKTSNEDAESSSSAKVQNHPKSSSASFQLAKSSSQSSTGSNHRPLERTVANSIGTDSSSNSYHNNSPSLKLVSGNNVCLATVSAEPSSDLPYRPLAAEGTEIVNEENCSVTASLTPSTSSSNSSVSSSASASSSSSSPSSSSSSSLPPTPPVRKRTTAPQPGASHQPARSTLDDTGKQDHTQESGKSAPNLLPPSTTTTAFASGADSICASTSSFSATSSDALLHRDNIDDVGNQQRLPTTAANVQSATKPQLPDLSSAANNPARLGSMHNTNSFVNCPKPLSSLSAASSNLVNCQGSTKIAVTEQQTAATEGSVNESLSNRRSGVHYNQAADDNDYENIISAETESTSGQADPDDIAAIVSEEFVVISSCSPSNLQPLSDHSPPNESSSILSSSSSSSSFEQLSIVNSGSTAPAVASSSGSSRRLSRRHHSHEPDPDYDEEDSVAEAAVCDPVDYSGNNMLTPFTHEVVVNGQPKRQSKRANRDGRRRFAREISSEEVQVASSTSNNATATSPTENGQESLLNDCQNLISRFESSLLIGNGTDECSPLSLNLNSDQHHLTEQARSGRRRSNRRRNSSHSSDDELAAIVDSGEAAGTAAASNCTATTPASGGSTPTTSTSSSYVNEVCPNEDIELDPALQNNAAANYQHNLEDIVEVSDSGSDDNAEVPPQATPLSGRSREDLDNHYDDDHLSSFEYHRQYLSSQSRDRSALQSSSSNLSHFSEDDDDADDDEADEEQYESTNEENDVSQDVTEDNVNVDGTHRGDNSTEQQASSSTSTADHLPESAASCSTSSNAMTTSPVHRPLERVGVQSPTAGGNLPKDLLKYGPVVLRNRRHPSHQRRSNTVVLGSSISNSSTNLRTKSNRLSQNNNNLPNVRSATITRLPSIPDRTGFQQRYNRVETDEPLPPNWEARLDAHGRLFYIDHSNRTTTWARPSFKPQAGSSSGSRPSIASNAHPSATTSASVQPKENSSGQGTSNAYSNILAHHSAAQSTLGTAADNGSASSMAMATAMYLSNAENIHRQQLDRRYQSIRRSITGRGTRDFANNTGSLYGSVVSSGRSGVTVGWESKRDGQNKLFFIDHTTRTTTYIDPRLPLDIPAVNPHQISIVPIRRRGRGSSSNTNAKGAPVLVPTNVINPSTGATVNQGHAAGQVESAGAVISNPLPVPPPRPLAASPVPGAGPSTSSPSVASTSSAMPSTSEAAVFFESAVPTAYNDKVVAFLQQPNIIDILSERKSSIKNNTSLRDRIFSIRSDGVEALHRFSNDMELIMLLSLFENEIMSYVPPSVATPFNVANISSQRSQSTSSSFSFSVLSMSVPTTRTAGSHLRRDFDAKLRNFYRKIEKNGYGQGPGKLKLIVRRDNLLADAFNKIMSISTKKELQKSRLYISFLGEEGLDYGGPSREFFFLLSRELFNPYYALFEYSANDQYTVQISPMSACIDDHLEWFRFSGRVLGLALIHQYLLDVFFTRPFYKALLKSDCDLSDLESLDAGFHQSLMWIKENDISETAEALDLTFSVTEETLKDGVIEKELKPGGRNISLTERNKKEYIERMIRWRVERGVAEQSQALLKGFNEVVEPRFLAAFDARELELVIAGTAEIDVQDWRKNTEYRSGYHDGHPVIQWYWAAIEHRFDNEQRLRLLQFVTGTSSIPYEGFAALRGSNGPRKFCIEKWGKPTSLPRAHTCFNRLDLPPYTSFENLYEKLLLAVEESSTFGIE